MNVPREMASPIAISIRQPWAEMILIGEKVTEYRSRRLSPAMLDKDIHVYVPMSYGYQADEDRHELWDRLEELPRGKVVGIVTFSRCTLRGEQWAWHIGSTRRVELRKPTYKPQPGFFRPW